MEITSLTTRLRQYLDVLAYLARRLVLAAITTFAITVVTFIILHLPPVDFVTAYAAQAAASGTAISAAEADAMRLAYGLNQPLYVQYWKWLAMVASGDFGRSFEYGRPVTEVIGDRLWLTVVLSLGAIVVTWALALPIGIYSAVRQYSIGDYVFTFLGFVGLAIPNFLLALIIMYFGSRLFGINVGGLFSAEQQLAPWTWAKFIDLLAHLPVPILILSLAGTAQLVRIMRANLLDELNKPYVVTARAKGMREWRLVLRYPVRLALNPLISTIGWYLPALFSGSLIVATVMNLPNIGPLLLRALINQDMYLAGGILLIYSFLTIVGTLLSDVLLALIDPRIRMEN
jgi:peptide/nickel transport system permease protein